MESIDNMRKEFEAAFGRPSKRAFTACGRSELIGNHTDHQHGLVLACGVNLSAVALAARNDRDEVRLISKGFPACSVALDALEPDPNEYGTTTALLRGVLSGIVQRGANPFGLDIYVVSNVLAGSGLSSSATIEVLLAGVMEGFYLDGDLDEIGLAMIGQRAENVYFGKPSGLLDQMACALGGIQFFDFSDPAVPVAERINFDFSASGHALVIIDSGADHANLTDCYAAIPRELSAIDAFFGASALRDVNEDDFYAALPVLRRMFGDRAVLRAMHVFDENKRVLEAKLALERNDFDAFLAALNASGESSYTLLQNVIAEGHENAQAVAFTISFAKKLLNGRGAVRVHGGGFAGTVLAIVPNDLLDDFCAGMDRVLAPGACRPLSVRKRGVYELTLED
ncbi:MAG: galactokinase [Clostridia bacterium]|nr:galactokinase [Clostridia bacterium]